MSAEAAARRLAFAIQSRLPILVDAHVDHDNGIALRVRSESDANELAEWFEEHSDECVTDFDAEFGLHARDL